MKKIQKINRRKFLQYSAFGAVAVSFPGITNSMSSNWKGTATADFHPDVEIELNMRAVKIPILDGPQTLVWKITGDVLSGPKDTVVNLVDNYLAPILNFRKGQKVRIFLRNYLPAQSILHWHGLHVPAKMDGNPMYAIDQGETFVYEFEILNRAGTYFYHSHTHGVTAKQVYSGLAGMLIVRDREEQALGLPTGEYDLPLVLQDRSFDQQNQLHYSNHMMQRMRGFLGEQIFVNGRPDFVMPVASTAYRFRVLNGSNSRIYKLGWGRSFPITVIGTDGGLLEKPVKVPYLMVAPGERYDIWVDFSGRKAGDQITLKSLPFEGGSMMGMMGGMGRMGGMGMGGMMGRRGGMGGRMGMGMMGGSLPLGGDYPLMRFKITKQVSQKAVLPSKLSTINKFREQDADNVGNARRITLSMRHMSALLNGRSYRMHDIRADEIMPLNSKQLISFNNGYYGGHGMSMPHSMHMHGEQFQIIERKVNPRFESTYETVSQGLVSQGWQDTVLVMPGEEVSIVKPFNDFTGIFMYHCHNLEHEDMGMMRDLLVK